MARRTKEVASIAKSEPQFLLVCGLCAFLPLLMAPGLFLSHDVMPKVAALGAVAALLLSVHTAWMPGISRLWESPRGRWFLLLAAGQVASLWLSTALSGRPLLSIAGTTWRRFGALEQTTVVVIAVSLAGALAINPGVRIRLLRWLTLAGGIAAVYASLQYLELDPLLDPRLYSIDYLGGITRPPATLGHAIYFSGWLAPLVLLAAHDAIRGYRWQAAVAVLGVIAIVLSGTRGSILAVVTGLALFGIHGKAKWKEIGKAALVVVVVLTAVIGTPLGADLRHRMAQWLEDPGGPRLMLWKESAALAITQPVVGHGPETFTGEFRRVQSEQLSVRFPDFFNETPHSALVDAAVAQGVPGLFILAAVFALGFLGDWRIRTAMAALFVALLFTSFSLASFLLCWTLAALALPPPGECSPQPAVHRPVRVAFALIGVVLALPALALAAADIAYSQVNAAVLAGDSGAAFRAVDLARRWSIGLPAYELWSSRQMAMLGRASAEVGKPSEAWERARFQAAAAEERGEEPFNAAYQSAVLSVAAGDLETALAKARLAASLAPTWYKPRLLLSQLLDAEGLKDEARGLAEESRRLGWRGK